MPEITAPATGPQGASMRILVTRDGNPVSGLTVRGTAHPGLPSKTELAVGITDTDGAIYWTPKLAGRIELRADDAVTTTHITQPIDSGITALGVLPLILALGWGWWASRSRS